MDNAGDRTQKNASKLTILKAKVTKSFEKISHDKSPSVC
jgi:hypothetical protein